MPTIARMLQYAVCCTSVQLLSLYNSQILLLLVLVKQYYIGVDELAVLSCSKKTLAVLSSLVYGLLMCSVH